MSSLDDYSAADVCEVSPSSSGSSQRLRPLHRSMTGELHTVKIADGHPLRRSRENLLYAQSAPRLRGHAGQCPAQVHQYVRETEPLAELAGQTQSSCSTKEPYTEVL